MKNISIARFYISSSPTTKLHFCFIFTAVFRLSQRSFSRNTRSRLLSPGEMEPHGIVRYGWPGNKRTDTRYYRSEKSSQPNHIDLVMQSDTFVHNRYYNHVTFMPDSTYKLDYWG